VGDASKTASVPAIEQRLARVFISYSRKDAAFAGRLETALKARRFEVFIASPGRCGTLDRGAAGRCARSA
jgi:hypothetical protein